MQNKRLSLCAALTEILTTHGIKLGPDEEVTLRVSQAVVVVNIILF